MAITKRIVLRTDPKGCLDYVLDRNKDDRHKYATGVNCSYVTADAEFDIIKRTKARGYKGTHTGYHTIQSFDVEDNITPEIAHEIGVKLAQELYGDEYQSVVVTHLDKTHLHNHIVTNNISFKTGRALKDELKKGGKTTQSLEHIREISDRLCKEYGLSTIEGKESIPYYKQNKRNQYTTVNFRNVIEGDIKKYKLESSSFEDMIRRMEKGGYEFKNKGKATISLKRPGMKKTARLRNIAKGEYTKEKLDEYFYGKIDKKILKTIDERNVAENTRVKFFDSHGNEVNPKDANSRFNRHNLRGRQFSRNGKIIALEEGLHLQKVAVTYSITKKYYKRSTTLSKAEQRKIVKEMQDSINRVRIMSSMNIGSYNLLESKIVENESLKKNLDMEVSVFKKNNNNVLELKNDIVTYQRHFEIGEAYHNETNPELKENFMRNYKKELTEFLAAEKNIKKVYPDLSKMSDTYKISDEINSKSRELNTINAKINAIQKNLGDLEYVKATRFTKRYKDIFQKSFSFSDKNVDEGRSSDTHICVKVPYTKEYVYLERENVLRPKGLNGKSTFFILEDIDYDLYDKDNNVKETVKGTKLIDIISVHKEQIKQYYEEGGNVKRRNRKQLNDPEETYDVHTPIKVDDDGDFIFSVPTSKGFIQQENDEKEKAKRYLIKIPNTYGKDYLMVDAKDTVITNNGGIMYCKINVRDDIQLYNENASPKNIVKGEEISQHYENKTEKFRTKSRTSQ